MKKNLQKTVGLILFAVLCLGVFAQDVNPVKNLTATCNNNGRVTLNWTKPDAMPIDGFWLTWSTDNILGSVGTGQAGEISSVARFTASDLTAKGVTAGDRIVQMQIISNTMGCSEFKIQVWEGGFFYIIPLLNIPFGSSGTSKVDQQVDLAAVGNGWTTIPLAQPHPISTSSELWIGYTVTADETAYPLGYDQGPREPNKSDLIGMGGQWTTLNLASQQAPDGPYSFNAAIKAFVTKQDLLYVTKYEIYKGTEKVGEATGTNFVLEGVAPGEYEFCVKAVYNNGGSSVNICRTTTCNETCNTVTNLAVEYAKPECDKATITWTAPTAGFPVKYNVYRNDVKIASEIEGTTYIDEDFNMSTNHIWSVEAVCITLVSNKINRAMDACFVGINENINNAHIYPNPASQTVTIQVESFQKVEIYNTFGQLVDVKNSNEVNVSNYSQGVYIFKIFDTDNKTAVRRVTVMR